MTAHVHADKMAQYAEDAKTTDKPWELWEFTTASGGVGWIPCDELVEWSPRRQYRRKPRTININGYEVPEPLKEAPIMGSPVFLVSISHINKCSPLTWDNAGRYPVYLKMGLLHLTREAAELHAKALQSFTEPGHDTPD